MKSKIGVCVVGSGRAGMIHAKNFLNQLAGARLIAMVDPVEEVAKAACEELGIDVHYTDHTQALENPEIDAFVIVSPTTSHRHIVVDLASAGKHILCEKPMAITLDECDEMIEACDRGGSILQIGFMRRFDRNYLKAKEIVDSGEIGQVVMVRSNTRGPSMPRPWMYDLKKSNGPLAEVNSHDIDTLRWFTGSEFESLFAVGGNFRNPEVSTEFPDFYDNLALVCEFKNGMQGMIDGAQGVGYAYDARTEVLGTKGCVFIGQLKDHAVLTCTSESGQGAFPAVESWRRLFKEAYLNEAASFIDCIRFGKNPQVTGLDGRMAVAVVNAGNQSITEGKVIRF